MHGEKMKTVIRLENLSKSYHLGEVEVPALRSVNIEIHPGEFTALIGASGSGKSTLLNMIGCIDQPSSGKIWLEDVDVQSLSDNEKSDLRNQKIGFIFQSFNLVPVLSVFENVELPLLINPRISLSDRKGRVLEAIRDVGLERFARHRPDQACGIQHAGLGRGGWKPGRQGGQLGLEKGRGHRADGTDLPGILGGETGDRRDSVDAERGEGLQIRLEACARTAVGAGDGECDGQCDGGWHGVGREHSESRRLARVLEKVTSQQKDLALGSALGWVNRHVIGEFAPGSPRPFSLPDDGDGEGARRVSVIFKRHFPRWIPD